LTDIDSIRDNIRNILFFRKGDYPDEPEFGIGLQDFIFDPADELLRTSLGQEIRRQIVRYEPRVTIRVLTVTSPKWADDTLQIDLDILVGNIPLTGLATASGTFSLSQANPA
jgi:phage baseplate assembly protein W